MRHFFAFTIFYLVWSSSEFVVDEDGLLVLDAENIYKAISSHKMLLVMFYAPWCGHSKRLAPEWAKAARKLHGHPVKLARCDASNSTTITQKFGVRGFPTLTVFRSGERSEYNGGRSESEIFSWVNKKISPLIKISTVEELHNLFASNSIVIIGIFDSIEKESSRGVTMFYEMAVMELRPELVYILTSSEAIRSNLQLSLTVTDEYILVLKKFDLDRVDIPIIKNMYDEGYYSKLVAKYSVPLVQELTAGNAKKLFSSPIQTFFIMFTDVSSPTHAPALEVLKQVAAECDELILFVTISSTETAVLAHFEIEAESLPKLIISDLRSGQLQRFPFTESLTTAELTGFINNFFKGTLKPQLISEAVAPNDTQGSVWVLRGSSFKELVLDSETGVLVLFYAPWCAICRRLLSVWDEVGQAASGRGVVIAKIDATANDISGVTIRGYPTVMLFRKGRKKSPVLFDRQGRDVDDVMAFLTQHEAPATSSVHSEL